jgi:predicted ArsR family transcriptional regulator
MAGSNGDGMARNSALAPAVDWERLARANTHPMRISILEILGIDDGRTLSPIELSQELRMPLSNTNYHVTELHKSGLIDLSSTRRVRGATEHFYRLADRSANGQTDRQSKTLPRQPRAPRRSRAPQGAKR